MISAEAIVSLHDEQIRAWHNATGALHTQLPVPPNAPSSRPGEASDGLSPGSMDWLVLVADQHLANFELWHIEDEARAPGATDKQLADVKRRIDRTNQRRNDLAEKLDVALLDRLREHDLPDPEAPLHSESPGLMIDRLSILALKIWHTREEAERAGAPAGHAERNLERLAILEEQRRDLAGCLDALARETLAGTRRFKLYRQLKMYNDPALNPAIYRREGGESGA
jgi:hypothetical protein